MKSKQLCPGLQVTVACVVVLLLGFLAPQAESATNKTIQVGAGVGGSAGWTNTANFDYQAFISKYTIYVGDLLNFTNVDSINHTVVLLATKAAYDACEITNQTLVDGVILEPQNSATWTCPKPATYYFVCALPGHCTLGNQKLYFTCHSATGAGGAPAPTAFAPAPVSLPPTPTSPLPISPPISSPPTPTSPLPISPPISSPAPTSPLPTSPPISSPPAPPPVTTTTPPPTSTANPPSGLLTPTTSQNPINTPPPPPPRTTIPPRPGAAAGLNLVGLPSLALLVAACYFGSIAIAAGL